MSNDNVFIEYPRADEQHEQDFLESVLDKDELIETPAEEQITRNAKRLRAREKK